MANLPASVDSVINSEFLSLLVGSDTWVLMQDCTTNLDHPEKRVDHSGAGAIYFYGALDGFIDFTLTMSEPELATLRTKNTRGSTGFFTSETWKVKGSDTNGNATTLTVTGILPKLQIIRPSGVGEAQYKGRIRLTSPTATVS